MKRGRHCKNCNACKRLYRRYWFRFFGDKLYYCNAREEITALDGYCEQWKKKKAEYSVSAERLKQAEEDLRFLMEEFKGM